MPKTNGFALAVLVVDDDEISCERARAILESAGIQQDIVAIHDGIQTLPALRNRDFGVVLLDLTLPSGSGEEILTVLRAERPEIPVIVVTGSDDTETAVRCMKAGAFDYLVKPVEPSKLAADVRVALEMRTLQIENRLLADRFLKGGDTVGPAFHDIVTQNRTMLTIFKYIEAIARSPKVVLVTGETGTGKELIAQAIHKASGRSGELLAVNTAELDDAMFSDTLFGHKKGAYTGAEERRKGLVEAAGSGTLFLDEIGDLGPRTQTKLLRLLEAGEYLPIGSDVPSRTDVRIIAATNRDLEAAVAAGTFRRDLFFRLSLHRVRLPPLRERMDDLPLLFDHFLKKAAAELGLGSPPEYSARHLARMANYDFPGNIRELEAMVFDAVSRSVGRCLDSRRFRGLTALRSAQRSSTSTVTAPLRDAIDFPSTLPTARDLMDKLYAAALSRTGGSQSAAAKLIGVSQQTLSNWMRRQETGDVDDEDA